MTGELPKSYNDNYLIFTHPTKPALSAVLLIETIVRNSSAHPASKMISAL
jgi:hypothetical protein